MKAVDATYPIDLLRGLALAVAKSRDLDAAGEVLVIPAPALAEVMAGAHFIGGTVLRETMRLIAEFEVVAVGEEVAHEAGRLGAEMRRRGRRMSAADLLVAAACLYSKVNLITRDAAFAGVPGLAVEAY